MAEIWRSLSRREYEVILCKNQCFLDVQISCHFVFQLVRYFRDFYLYLPVPLHLTGSDLCEIFFSKVGECRVWKERKTSMNKSTVPTPSTNWLL
jgi:hypothetical protein